MSATDLLCLNRIIKPQISLEEFLKFTADLGIKYVEVRNDFTDKGVLDGLSDAVLQKAFKDTGTKALTINALYPFEDLLHDTFHHYLGGESEFFPKETAIVHVSGLLPGKTKAATTDEDRILVTIHITHSRRCA